MKIWKVFVQSPDLISLLIRFIAGIPTWSLGRKFDRGMDVTREVPELKLPLLLGIFGSAFCATLNHYYDEIRPFLVSLGWGLQTVDDLVSEVGRQNHIQHPVPLNVHYRGDTL